MQNVSQAGDAVNHSSGCTDGVSKESDASGIPTIHSSERWVSNVLDQHQESASGARVVAIRGPMGSGKTQAVSKLHPTGKLVALSTLISLVGTLAVVFSAKPYSEDRGKRGRSETLVATERVASTMHSLLLLAARDWSEDVLVVDEVTEVFRTVAGDDNIRSQDRARILQTLLTAIRTARRVYIADANLTALDVAWLADAAGVPRDQCLFVVLDHVEPRGPALELPSREVAIEHGSTLARAGQTVLVVCSTCSDADVVSKRLERDHIEHLVVTRRTSMEPEVQAWLRRPQTSETGVYQVVVASPSIQSGVSFDVRDGKPLFQNVVHIGKIHAMHLYTHMQQCGRVRGAPNLWYWITATQGLNSEVPSEADIAAAKWKEMVATGEALVATAPKITDAPTYDRALHEPLLRLYARCERDRRLSTVEAADDRFASWLGADGWSVTRWDKPEVPSDALVADIAKERRLRAAREWNRLRDAPEIPEDGVSDEARDAAWDKATEDQRLAAYERHNALRAAGFETMPRRGSVDEAVVKLCANGNARRWLPAIDAVVGEVDDKVIAKDREEHGLVEAMKGAFRWTPVYVFRGDRMYSPVDMRHWLRSVRCLRALLAATGITIEGAKRAGIAVAQVERDKETRKITAHGLRKLRTEPVPMIDGAVAATAGAWLRANAEEARNLLGIEAPRGGASAARALSLALERAGISLLQVNGGGKKSGRLYLPHIMPTIVELVKRRKENLGPPEKPQYQPRSRQQESNGPASSSVSDEGATPPKAGVPPPSRPHEGNGSGSLDASGGQSVVRSGLEPNPADFVTTVTARKTKDEPTPRQQNNPYIYNASAAAAETTAADVDDRAEGCDDGTRHSEVVARGESPWAVETVHAALGRRRPLSVAAGAALAIAEWRATHVADDDDFKEAVREPLLNAMAAGGAISAKHHKYGQGGRIYLSDLSIQNVPSVLRSYLVPSVGNVFIDIDMRCAYPRIAAAVSGDDALMATLDGPDFYTALAATFGIEGVEARDRVKRSFNAFLNGVGARRIDEILGTTGRGAEFLGGLRRAFPVLASKLDAIDADFGKRGPAEYTVHTLTGRTRKIDATKPGTVLSATWTCVEGEILDLVLERLHGAVGDLGGALIMPMYDGLLVECPLAQATVAKAELVKLMHWACAAAGVPSMGVKAKVLYRWGLDMDAIGTADSKVEVEPVARTNAPAEAHDEAHAPVDLQIQTGAGRTVLQWPWGRTGEQLSVDPKTGTRHVVPTLAEPTQAPDMDHESWFDLLRLHALLTRDFNFVPDDSAAVFLRKRFGNELFGTHKWHVVRSPAPGGAPSPPTNAVGRHAA